MVGSVLVSRCDNPSNRKCKKFCAQDISEMNESYIKSFKMCYVHTISNGRNSQFFGILLLVRDFQPGILNILSKNVFLAKSSEFTGQDGVRIGITRQKIQKS